MKPYWVKGHARRAAALFGLQCYGEAREAYERALKYEPDDAGLQRGRDNVSKVGCLWCCVDDFGGWIVAGICRCMF